jgi:hypothetical protein
MIKFDLSVPIQELIRGEIQNILQPQNIIGRQDQIKVSATCREAWEAPVTAKAKAVAHNWPE